MPRPFTGYLYFICELFIVFAHFLVVDLFFPLDLNKLFLGS